MFSRIVVAKRNSDVEQGVPSPFRKNLVVMLKVLHPIKTVQLTMKQFQNKNTSAQSLLGEHGPLIVALREQLRPDYKHKTHRPWCSSFKR